MKRATGRSAGASGRGRPREFDADEALLAALRLFWRQGYEATSMSELTEAMGLSRSSLYATFGNKHDVLLAAVERYVEGCLGDLHEIAATVPDPATAVRRMLARIAAPDDGDRGCFLVNCITELAADDATIVALGRRTTVRIERLLADTLAATRRDGEGGAAGDGERRRVRRRARALMSTAYGATLMRKSGMSSREVREMLKAMDILIES